LSRQSHIRLFCHHRTCGYAVVTFVALFWNRISFCGELQDAAANGDLQRVHMLLQANPNLISTTDYHFMDGFTPLLAAAANDHLDVVAFLLSKNSDVNAGDIDRGWTALHYAASDGDAGMVKLLMAKGANVNAAGRTGDTPLHLAAENDHMDVVALLQANNATVNNVVDAVSIGDLDKVKMFVNRDPTLAASKGQFGMSLLHLAAWHGQKEVAVFLLANHADVNGRTNEQKTPLHYAAQYGHLDVVGLLLANGADVTAKTNYRETALHLAAMNGKKNVVDALAAHNAEYDIFDAVAVGDLDRIKILLKQHVDLAPSNEQYGDTPLQMAATAGQKDAAALLLDNGASIDARDRLGQTPLLDAAVHGHANVVELLLAKNASANAKDNYGHTPLLYAAGWGHADIVELLLRNNADPNARDSSGFSPLYEAVRNNRNDVVKLLLAANADPNVKYRVDGTTPLHVAVVNGDIAIVEMLLANKADVNAPDNRGITPLGYSMGHGKDIADLLRQHGGK